MKKIVFVILFFILSLPGTGAAAEQPVAPKPEVIFFYSVTCHECNKLENEFLPRVRERYGGKINLEMREIGDIENYKLLIALKERYSVTKQQGPPVIFVDGYFLWGRDEIQQKLFPLIDTALYKETKEEVRAPSVDLMSRFFSLSGLTVAGLGLVDGINPCAFTVIVFFISYLGLQGYGKKRLIIIGLCYICAVFITYFLIGLGIFNCLYQTEGFWQFRKIFNYSIGGLSLVFGAFAVYDLVLFLRTGGKTDGFVQQLPRSVKNRIHAVIGMYYRKQGNDIHGGQWTMFRLVLSAFITGFLISILESLCTGQTYLPTITFVLKTTNIKIQALAYLLLYNIMFIFPLAIVFIFALGGVSSHKFSGFIQKNMVIIKFCMALLLFGLGAYLIWRV